MHRPLHSMKKSYLLHSYTLFGMIKQALGIGCNSNMACRGSIISDILEFGQRP